MKKKGVMGMLALDAMAQIIEGCVERNNAVEFSLFNSTLLLILLQVYNSMM